MAEPKLSRERRNPAHAFDWHQITTAAAFRRVGPSGNTHPIVGGILGDCKGCRRIVEIDAYDDFLRQRVAG